MKLTDVVRDAREAGAPLVAIETADQQAAIAAICNASNGVAKVRWDCTRGIEGINEAGAKWVAQFGDADEVRQNSQNPATALEMADKLPKGDAAGEGGMFFVINAHRFIADPSVSTAALVKRDSYKTSGRTMFLLGPKFDLPAELRQDVIVIDDPLPTDAELRELATTLVTANGLTGMEAQVERAVGAIRGLAPFPAETALAMSLRKNGINVDSLWERKRMQIEQTKGLSLQLRGPKFADIGGNAAIVQFARLMMAGKDQPRAIYLIDEIDKYMAGSTGPGAQSVDADYLGVLLRRMETFGLDGAILLSPPGCGKTLFAIALAMEFDLPLIHFDFGAMKGRYVGDSESAVREAFKTADGVAGGRAFVVATCNRLDSLAPELRRRFTSGLWYFDLPDKVERGAIWAVQQKANGLPIVGDITFDEGWTGAEIRNCCRKAYQLDIPLAEAAQYVVPVSQSDPDSIKALRTLAKNRFLSANYPGTYHPDREVEGVRRVRVQES